MILCPLHHAAPADDAPRCCGVAVLLFFPDHRLSNSASSRVDAPGVELIVGGELKCPRPGEAWRIEASRTHSVHNHSPVDRITILFDTVAAETPAP